MQTLVEGEWKEYQGNVYRCPVHLIHEEDGRYSVIAASLPGVASFGNTEQDGLRNIQEALAAAISNYKEDHESIPWLEEPREPEPGMIVRWVIVHV